MTDTNARLLPLVLLLSACAPAEIPPPAASVTPVVAAASATAPAGPIDSPSPLPSLIPSPIPSPSPLPENVITDVLWRPDGGALLVVGAYSLSLVGTGAWQPLWSIPNLGYWPVVFTDGGDGLLLMDGNGTVIRVDPASGALSAGREVQPEGRFAFSPDGRLLAATLGGDITLLDWESGEAAGLLETDLDSGAVYDLAFSADGRWLVAGSDNGDIQAWDVTSGARTLMRPAVIPSPVYVCEVSGRMAGEPPPNLLVVCSYPSADYQSTYYSAALLAARPDAAGASLVIQDKAGLGYHGFTASADRSRVAVFAGEAVEIWSPSGGLRTRNLEGASGNRMAFNPSAAHLLAVWSGHAVQVWDVGRGVMAGQYTSRPAQFPPEAWLTPTRLPSPTPSLTPTPPAFTRALYLAEPFLRGEDVRWVQQRLLELGYDELHAADGIYGGDTEAAVRHFQQANALEADGIVGPKTWEALASGQATGP
ncbi:MAG: hypothetical protein FJZ96_00455 [Chloroflexi bacterium]|nr:hypothetical protein [Chloroflexota bacterium]